LLQTDTTPAPHHSVFTGQMPFLPPNQQRQSTKLKESLTKSSQVDVQQLFTFTLNNMCLCVFMFLCRLFSAM